jgi:hypothetical protein
LVGTTFLMGETPENVTFPLMLPPLLTEVSW